MFPVRNGARFRVRSSDNTVLVDQNGGDVDLRVNVAAVAPTIESSDGSIVVNQVGNLVDLSLDGGDPWVVAREVDIGAWVSTDFAAGGDGNYVLGGLTWTVAGSANANAGSATNGGFFRRNAADVGDDGLPGLRIFHDASTSTELSRTTQTGPRVTIPLESLIPDYDETAEYLFELHVTRFADSSAGTPPAGLRALMGIYSPANTPAGSGARFTGVAIQRVAASNGNPTTVGGGAAALPISALSYSGGDDVIGILVSPEQVGPAYSGQFGADWPDTNDLTGVGAVTELLDTGQASNFLAQGTTVLELGVRTGSSSTGSVDVMYGSLRVLRKVP